MRQATASKTPLPNDIIERTFKHFMENGALKIHTFQESICKNLWVTLNEQWDFGGITIKEGNKEENISIFLTPPNSKKPVRYRLPIAFQEAFMSWVTEMDSHIQQKKAPQEGKIPQGILFHAGVCELTPA